MSSRTALVVLSPHLDDAALSCGGRIARAVAAGRSVRVITAFTRDEPVEESFQLARELRRWWQLPAGEVMRRRRAEDLEACATLGTVPLHLDFAEAPYRSDASGRPLYPDLASLFGDIHPEDATLVGQLAERIRGLCAEGCEVIGPLGVGHHVDHQVVRQALEQVRPTAALYEEFPYTEWKRLAVRRALGQPRQWEADTLMLELKDVELRLAAIEAYRSQVPSLFRTSGRLRRQLRRALRRNGGERLWRRKKAAASTN